VEKGKKETVLSNQRHLQISKNQSCLILVLVSAVSALVSFRLLSKTTTLWSVIQRQPFACNSHSANLCQLENGYKPIFEYVSYFNGSSRILNLPGCEGLRCYFYPTITANETQLFRDLVKSFDKVAQDANISYFATFGTLLGLYRHGGNRGMIP
jgi:hypothetical protein